MLPELTRPEMGTIFSDENRFQLMLDVSLTACEALMDIGRIPREAYEEIKARAGYDIPRIRQLTEETHDEAQAFLLCLSERIGANSCYLQPGVCPMDIVDTATSLQISQVADILLGRLNLLRKSLADMAHEYKYTLMLGRTHGVSAEPITFGLKLALWVREVDRAISRLNHARSLTAVGMISGVVGTFASVDPHVETFVCRRLGLHPAYITTQCLQRDRMADFLTVLALIGGTLEKFANDIRNMQRNNIGEVDEASDEGLRIRLSMPMPQNSRPYDTEQISGIARVLRGNAQVAMENIAIDDEFDGAFCAAERVILPDSCILLDYMLWSFTNTITNLHVYPDIMMKNIDSTLGLVFSQRVMLALMDKGLTQEKAYDIVMRNAKTSWENRQDFQYLILQDQEVRQYFSSDDIMALFDYDYFRRQIDYIFARADI